MRTWAETPHWGVAGKPQKEEEMRVYTIFRYTDVEPKIHVGPDRMIAVGEPGRGREQVLVPVPDGVTMTPEGSDKGYALTSAPGAGALILIRDQSGFRGSWTLGGPYRSTGCQQGKIIPYGEGECPRCGGRYEHQAVVLSDLPAGVRILAQGRCAQGIAGRAGGGPEYLLWAPPGAVLGVSRSGRTYGAPADYYIRVADDGSVTITDVIAESKSREAESAFAALLRQALESPAEE